MIRPATRYGAEHVARNLDPVTLAEMRLGTGQDDDAIRAGIVANVLAAPVAFVVYGPTAAMPDILVSFTPMMARRLGVSFLTTTHATRAMIRDALKTVDACATGGLPPYTSAEILIPIGRQFHGAHGMARRRCAKVEILKGTAADGSDIARYTFERN